MIESKIKNNTALISIMHANNELGTINDVKRIGQIAHSRNIPFHTDAVQTFGKYKPNMKKNNIDALSMSFHKLYGPMGVGMIIINNEFIQGYGLCSIISGSQQYSLRGGTENVPGIAGSLAALIDNFKNRKKKNQKLLTLKKHICDTLGGSIPFGEYKTYFSKPPKRNEFVILGAKKSLPNTLLLSFAKNIGPPFCNSKLKKFLNQNNIIVSIGSACSTRSTKASHVLEAIKAPAVIKRGVIRISLSDKSTKKEINTFCKYLIRGISSQCS